ncbi:MFS peptide transporter, putative [Penicillium digitatum]|uniref:MFS peptide transporter, putative n=3 Tax=Penicillium digitatum TaxID=36651 RepID=K9FQZ6_PEND2|nr:MFS peptide transporter, putative [Penicillium digitatum Pd1]EKV11604.1 MFS peptide transporter, putative [Penicillium digitatum PHI26]EKV14737.1 MFS peptide transporter, putative [Penicillium digitatum Pd1]QQK46375.1 MFS peptide transporter, putative [Penicillium digitatum]
MNDSDPMDVVEVVKSKAISHDISVNEKVPVVDELTIDNAPPLREVSIEGDSVDKSAPTAEELATLRRVAGDLPVASYSVAFVELCERFSYYGTTAVFVNFLQRPLPAGSSTGALVPGVSDWSNDSPGALGMGQQASTGLTLFNSFWSYIMPLFGAMVADQWWGRYRTIMSAIACALIGHTILVISAIPKVIDSPNGAIACFSIGLIIMGIGTGGFKANISPLIAEQYREDKPYVKTLASGERVIVDPSATVSRIYMYFYMMVNIGSFVGQVAMVYAERYVGFWLSYLLPTAMFCLCPAVLLLCRKHYILTPPSGSIYPKAFKVSMLAMKGHWTLNPVRWFKSSSTDIWAAVKPSQLGVNKPVWMDFDDAWVDEVRRGLLACRVFLWYPLYWLAYNQMLNNLTSQAATMKLGGVPNDIINNLNPIALIIFIPIFDHIVYPGIRKMGFHFTPLKRITAGFIVAALSMVVAAVTQHYIYKLGPCGNQANYCLEVKHEHTNISVWVQALTYIMGGISEILASITSLEYAYTKAPKNMRSLVQAVSLLMNAFSSAIGQAFVGLADDPLLTWNYTVVAILAFLGGIGFWVTNYKLDAQEDAMNMLPDSAYSPQAVLDEERK